MCVSLVCWKHTALIRTCSHLRLWDAQKLTACTPSCILPLYHQWRITFVFFRRWNYRRELVVRPAGLLIASRIQWLNDWVRILIGKLLPVIRCLWVVRIEHLRCQVNLVDTSRKCWCRLMGHSTCWRYRRKLRLILYGILRVRSCCH